MKNILFILAAISLLAFASCSKDDDVAEQQSAQRGGVMVVGGVERVDLSGMTFRDSTTTVNFENSRIGIATISIDVDTAMIKVDAPFSYTARKFVAGDYNYHIYDDGDKFSTKIDVIVTVDKENMEVYPASAQRQVKEILPDVMSAVYDKLTNKLQFELNVSQGKTVNYTLTKKL